MLINTYIQSVGDQVGGKFLSFPPIQTHVPRLHGAFYTVPPGLVVSGGRKFVWSLKNPLPQGVVGITNIYTETPTVEFDPITYSGADIGLTCTIQGQPAKSFKLNLLTTLSSSLGLQSSLNSNLIIINDYQINTLQFSLKPSLLDNYIYIGANSNDTQIVWSKPKYQTSLVGYKLEEWDALLNNWVTLTTQNQTYFNTVNVNTSYRVTPLYDLDKNVNSVQPTYLSNNVLNSNLINNAIKITSYLYTNNVVINQAANLTTFYSSIEELITEDKLNLKSNLFANNININQANSIASFFSELIELTKEENTTIKSTLYSSNININQTPNSLIFWAEQTGA